MNRTLPDPLAALAADLADVGVPPEARLLALRTLLQRSPSASNDNATLRWLDAAVADAVAAPAPSTDPPARPRTPEHLPLRDLLGVGGMGEVWAAHDERLRRVVALKTVRADLRGPEYAALLELEALLTASLRHPGIPEVYERGTLEDGRPYYTMPVYTGRTLRDLLDEQVGRPRGATTLRAFVDVVLRAAEAVAKAHALGVVHRDLKPENVYLGTDAEVVVLDWGIARAPVAAPMPAADGRTGIVGTRGYMAPEQEAGDRARIGPPTDVWALGLILEEARNAGRPGADEAGPHGHERRALAAIAARAAAHAPEDRHRDAGELAEELRRWRADTERRARALALVEQADEAGREGARIQARATRAREQAATLAAAVKPWQPVEEKRAAWQAEDLADVLSRQAELRVLERDRLLMAAFTHDPELPEAHARLAALYRARHAEAEAEKDWPAAARWEVMLRAHDRGEHAAYLAGDGAISVVTDPPGARATLYRFEERDRRLVPVLARELGATPVVEVPVPHGSWLVRLEADGHAPVDHPLLVRRLEHADGVAPGEAAPRPIRLPRVEDVGADDRVVTPGWTFLGGDPGAPSQAPRQRAWVDGFVMRRFPVTNRAYLAFLDDLARDRVDDALRLAPREKGPSYDRPGRLLYGWDADTRRFSLVPDAQGDVWGLDWPVMMVTLAGAEAYAAWLAARDGRPWRLPREDEWERAARGADGRYFPWGNFLDPTWALYRESWPAGATMLPLPVDTYEGDVSPFGVRGLAGGMRELATNVWGGQAEHYRGFPALRGGSWSSAHQMVRAATRTASDPRDTNPNVGFRLVRDD